jgi:F-type H+-transporting ATPase subunit delta
MIRRFARPYAAAIMDVAESTEKAAAVLAELERFAEILRGSDELQAVFENPGVEAAGKAGVVTAIAVRIGISALGQKILDVILKNDRINDLGDILEALGDMINTATNTVVAEVRSAHVLDESERERLRKALETKLGQKVLLELSTDPTLLGGFVATVGSEVWDASVVGQINKLREKLA